MKTRTTLFAAAAIVAALAGATALAHPGYGPGYGQGPGCGMGAGMGPGMMGQGQGMGQGMGPGMRHGMGPGMGQGKGMGPGMGNRDPAVVARQLDETKAALKITADQEAAWKVYADVQTRQVEARANFHDKMAPQWADPKITLPEREALRETMYKFRQEMQSQRVAAVRSLYPALTPEQKTVAEQQLFGPYGPAAGGRMGGGMGGGMGRHGGGGMGCR